MLGSDLFRAQNDRTDYTHPDIPYKYVLQNKWNGGLWARTVDVNFGHVVCLYHILGTMGDGIETPNHAF